MSPKTKIPIKALAAALLDTDQSFPAALLDRFSDLSPNDMKTIEIAWPKTPDWRRQAIMDDLENLAARDPLLSFEALCHYALKDEDAHVRKTAVHMLWDEDDPSLVETLIGLMDNDPSADVRAAVASVLSKYVYLGEIECISEELLHNLEDRLLQVYASKDEESVRRNAFEALGYSSRDEVPALIEEAYYSGNDEWLASSLFAISRSANKRWESLVKPMLNHDTVIVRQEAARAVGELEIKECLDQLLEMLADTDEELRKTVIWSLSQIGGEGVQDILERLYDECEDDQEMAHLLDALDNLAFTEDMEDFDLMDLEEYGDEEFLDMDEDDDNLDLDDEEFGD